MRTMIAGLLALMITGSAFAVQPKQTVSPGQTQTANTGGASHTVIWGQIRPSTTYGGWEIVPLSATLDGSGNMALIVKMAAGSAGSPASFSQVVSGSAFIGANGATGPFVTIANTISQGDITGAGKAVNFSVTNGGTYVNAPGNVLVLGNGGQFPVVGGTYFYGAVGSAGPAVTMQGHAPGSATQWGIQTGGAAFIASDAFMTIGGPLNNGGVLARVQTNSTQPGTITGFAYGTNAASLVTTSIPWIVTNGVARMQAQAGTPFQSSIGSTGTVAPVAPFSIILGRTGGSGSSSMYEPFTMTPTGTNGDMGLIVTPSVGQIGWPTVGILQGATTPVTISAVTQGTSPAATATALIVSCIDLMTINTQGTHTPIESIRGSTISDGQGAGQPFTNNSAVSYLVTYSGIALRSNGAQTAANAVYNVQGGTPFQSSGMVDKQMTATGYSGTAADVRSVGAAGLGTVTAYDVGSTQALGVTRTVDSTIAGGNEMWIGLDPSAAEAGVVYISFTSCNDAKLNGFPITHIGATLAAGANANFIGPYHRGNLNLKVGDKWYLYAASTLAVREHITQTR